MIASLIVFMAVLTVKLQYLHEQIATAYHKDNYYDEYEKFNKCKTVCFHWIFRLCLCYLDMAPPIAASMRRIGSAVMMTMARLNGNMKMQ